MLFKAMLPGYESGRRDAIDVFHFTLKKTTVIQFLNTQDYEDQSTIQPRRGKALSNYSSLLSTVALTVGFQQISSLHTSFLLHNCVRLLLLELTNIKMERGIQLMKHHYFQP